MRTFYIFLLRINIITFIAIALFVIIVVNVALINLPFLENVNVAETMDLFESATPFEVLFLAIIIGPLFETAIFQMVVIFISKSIFNTVKLRHYIYPVIASALTFGIVHFYSLQYFIIGSLSGLVYAFAYILLQKRRENAFFVIALIHSIYNLIPYSQEYIFK